MKRVQVKNLEVANAFERDGVLYYVEAVQRWDDGRFIVCKPVNVAPLILTPAEAEEFVTIGRPERCTT